jgi:hypothetical protein
METIVRKIIAASMLLAPLLMLAGCIVAPGPYYYRPYYYPYYSPYYRSYPQEDYRYREYPQDGDRNYPQDGNRNYPQGGSR